MRETYGVPLEEIQEGIRNGVRKVNIDTDIRLVMTGAMRRTMAENPTVFDPRVFMRAARDATAELCIARYVEFGSAGWASAIKPVSLEEMARRYAERGAAR